MTQIARTSEEILPEDRVTNALIEQAPRKCAVEVPYNNYGERGYVDLVLNTMDKTYIAEIKSNPESANQVIRQFQKMRQNFVSGTEYGEILEEKIYWLIFTASQSNLDHIKNNTQMYLSIQRNEEVAILMADEEGKRCSVFSQGEVNSEDIDNLKGVSDSGPLACPYCGKEYQMEAYYKKHVQGCFE